MYIYIKRTNERTPLSLLRIDQSRFKTPGWIWSKIDSNSPFVRGEFSQMRDESLSLIISTVYYGEVKA